MTENRKIFAVLSIYILILLCIVAIGSHLIVKKGTQIRTITVTETVVATEKIFVWADLPQENIPESEAKTETIEERIWIIREYEGRIGIFSEGGVLLDVIDVYVKTLPETDKNLLRDGIRITSDQALRAIIEDYSN